jgi:hypothetical protein
VPATWNTTHTFCLLHLIVFLSQCVSSNSTNLQCNLAVSKRDFILAVSMEIDVRSTYEQKEGNDKWDKINCFSDLSLLPGILKQASKTRTEMHCHLYTRRLLNQVLTSHLDGPKLSAGGVLKTLSSQQDLVGIKHAMERSFSEENSDCIHYLSDYRPALTCSIIGGCESERNSSCRYYNRCLCLQSCKLQVYADFISLFQCSTAVYRNPSATWTPPQNYVIHFD